MKLQQYVNSFTDPLRAEDSTPLFRLLDIRHKVARGLKDSVGFIDVSWNILGGSKLTIRTSDLTIPVILSQNPGMQ